MSTMLSALDKLVLHTIMANLQAQRTQTITLDPQFLYELGYSDNEIQRSFETIR